MRRLFIFGIAMLALAGCGVKPGSPEAPNPNSGFPHTYPDPSLDPGAPQ